MSAAELGQGRGGDTSWATLNEGGHSQPEFKGGANLSQAITPGGHIADTTQYPYFPNYHRKLADPSAFTWLALGTCFLQTGVVFWQARGVGVQFSQVLLVPYTFLGFVLLSLSTMCEFISGHTFSATLFGMFAGYFGSFLVLHVPWFGLTGSFDGAKPNAYAPGGAGAEELGAITGMYISAFVIVFFFFIVAATRESALVLSILVSIEIFFILEMCYFLKTDHSKALATAAGAFSFIGGILAWYASLASLLTPDSAFFTLPTFDFKWKD